MIKINVMDILHSQKKSLQWLANEINCDYSNIWKLCHNKTKLIRLDIIEKICNTLGCRVCDVIVIYDDEDEVEE
jgi:DNA-binding Xre family transcriptional regulator